MSRDLLLYLEDIESSCQKILRYTHGISFNDFQKDDRTYDAVIRNLEIIGEAVRNIPDKIRIKFPEVNWRSISALRNIVAHEYFGVKDEIIWDIIANEVPNLLLQIKKIISVSE